jgi:hypothetical protein
MSQKPKLLALHWLLDEERVAAIVNLCCATGKPEPKSLEEMVKMIGTYFETGMQVAKKQTANLPASKRKDALVRKFIRTANEQKFEGMMVPDEWLKGGG